MTPDPGRSTRTPQRRVCAKRYFRVIITLGSGDLILEFHHRVRIAPMEARRSLQPCHWV